MQSYYYSNHRLKKRIFWIFLWLFLFALLLLLIYIVFFYHPYTFGVTRDEPLTVTAGICGCVRHPAVYHMPAYSTLSELIKIAGGVTHNANTRNLDPCVVLQNDRVYYVPCICNPDEYIPPPEIPLDTCITCEVEPIERGHINILYGGGPETFWLIQLYPSMDLMTFTYIPWYTVFPPSQNKIKYINLTDGMAFTTTTVGNFLNEEIEYYIWQDRTCFIDMIDYLGGITIDIDPAVAKQLNLKPGRQHLSGHFAYEFVTCLDKSKDHVTGFEQIRISQMKFLKALFEKIKSLDNLPTTELRNVLACSQTNITLQKAISLAAPVLKMHDSKVEFYRLPGYPIFESEKEYYWYPDKTGFIRKRNELFVAYENY